MIPLQPKDRAKSSPETKRLRHRFRTGSLLAIMGFLLFMFQNFQPIPLKNLVPQLSTASARAVSPTDGSADMRKIAPSRPDVVPEEPKVIAQPQSGHDLGSVSQDWLMRQSHVITGGADEKILADVNRRMNRVFKKDDSESSFDSSSVSPENINMNQPNGNAAQLPAHTSKRKPASVKGEDDYFGMRPTSMNLVAVNQLQVGLQNKTKLSCAFEGSNVRWNVSRPINKTFDVNLQHESTKSKSMLNLNYSW